MNQIGFSKIILIFIIVVLIGVYWYWGDNIKTSLQTWDWKTYRNDEFGFEFKYPPNYYLTAEGELFSENEGDYIKSLNEGLVIQDPDRGPGFSITTVDNLQWIRVGFSLAKSRDSVLAQELKNKSTNLDYKKVDGYLEKIIKLNGLKISLGIFSNYPANDTYDLSAHFYDTQYNPIFIGLDRIGETLEDARNSPLNETIITILSTFKSTKITQGEPPITEQDLFKKYGFTIEFPESWEGYHMTEFVGSRHSYICFSFTGYCIMQIVMYIPEQFEKYKQELQDPRYNYLTPEQKIEALKYDYKNDKYYYIFTYSGCAELSQFECQRTNEVPEILKTFKFQ